MRTAHLTGRLGRDPEVNAPANSEYSVLNFSIANDDESRKNANTGEYEKITSWLDIVYWTKNPQHWIQQLTKGTLVAVECDVKQETWQTNEGQNRSRIKFVVRRGTFPIVMQKPGVAGSSDAGNSDSGFPDDIPF